MRSRKFLNTLFEGENLKLLKSLPSDSIDLIYIDPPFFTGKKQQADWIKGVKFEYEDSSAFFEKNIQTNSKGLHAYLDWMRVRLTELKRVLKVTGSIYLHVDYHASHYLKVLMDEEFGGKNFVNEIIWKRKFSCTHTNKTPRSFQNNHDTILLYSKSDQYTFNPQHRPYDQEYINKFNLIDENGDRYMSVNITSPTYRPNLVYTYKGFAPTEKGWSVSKERMKELDRSGQLIFPKEKDGRIRRKSYLKNMPGFPISNIWDDIGCVQGQSAEKSSWPTQKPVELLKRIIETSSNPGDIVLDCFAGSGTTLVAAEILNRKWIGAEMSPAATRVIKERFKKELSQALMVRDTSSLTGNSKSSRLLEEAEAA